MRYRELRLCAEGMSEKSCDHTVLVSDHLSSDEISRLHVHAGPAARISNKYYKINNTFHRVDSKDQGNFYCASAH